ncbi:MAG: hypothetical protein KC657_13435 [Myxococcales bacterium]|nr:hypothetical protein [Myxococcales bacterium]
MSTDGYAHTTRAVALGLAALAALGCGKDLKSFNTGSDDRFEGAVVRGTFVRAGVAEGASMCLSLDAEKLQDAPGHISTSDGLFSRTPLRPIPQMWHDPLSTLSFGEGRVQNLVYAASPADGGPEDAMVIVSLMKTDDVEVRVVRGAPREDAGAGPTQLFGVFQLSRLKGSCSF